jgi:hypothetical protein
VCGGVKNVPPVVDQADQNHDDGQLQELSVDGMERRGCGKSVQQTLGHFRAR